MTAQTWIDATRDMLLTDYIEEQATLAGELTAASTDTSVSFSLPTAIVSGVVPGSTIEIGTELMYVYTVPLTTASAASFVSLKVSIFALGNTLGTRVSETVPFTTRYCRLYCR